MTSRAESSYRMLRPLFQEGEGGSLPTSALQLFIGRVDFKTAKKLNRRWHSRLPRINDPAGPMMAGLHYAAEFGGTCYAVAIWTHPVSRSLPQETWLELRRLAVAPDAPRNTPSRMLSVMARLIRRDRPEIDRLVSYQDMDVHTGGIYRAAGWTPTTVKRFSTWNTPTSKNQSGTPRTRPPDQSKADKQRWELPLNESRNQ